MSGTPRYAVIFDLDGTLIDSLSGIGEAMNAALAVVGAPPRTLERLRRSANTGKSGAHGGCAAANIGFGEIEHWGRASWAPWAIASGENRFFC